MNRRMDDGNLAGGISVEVVAELTAVSGWKARLLADAPISMRDVFLDSKPVVSLLTIDKPHP